MADYLLRLWLNPTTAVRVNKLMNDLGLSSLGVFRASEYFHWPFPSLIDQSDLAKINSDDVRRVQSGDRPTIERLTKISACTEKVISNGTKFFIAVDPPPRSTLPAVERIKHSLRQQLNSEKIDQRSVYVGDGFAWAIVKGVVKDFFDIQPTVVRIHREIAPFLMRTTTFLCMRKDNYENELISDSSLELWDAPPDPAVLSWLRELYEHPNIEFRREVESVARRVIKGRRDNVISEEDDMTFHDFLCGLIAGDVRKAAEPLLYWFLTVETDLRERWDRALKVAQAEDSGFKEKVYKSCKVADPNHLTLGNILSLFIAFGSFSGLRTQTNYQKIAEDFIDLRNKVVHGRIGDSLIKDWKLHIETLLGYLDLRQWILDSLKIDAR